MAILTDPLFSDEARGQIAKCAIFKRSQIHPQFGGSFYHKINWTPPKIAQAAAWKQLCNQWRALTQATKDQWIAQAPGVLTGFNYFMQLKGQLPILPCYESPQGDLLLFNFTDTPYTPPAGDSITFEWQECI